MSSPLILWSLILPLSENFLVRAPNAEADQTQLPKVGRHCPEDEEIKEWIPFIKGRNDHLIRVKDLKRARQEYHELGKDEKKSEQSGCGEVQTLLTRMNCRRTDLQHAQANAVCAIEGELGQRLHCDWSAYAPVAEERLPQLDQICEGQPQTVLQH